MAKTSSFSPWITMPPFSTKRLTAELSHEFPPNQFSGCFITHIFDSRTKNSSSKSVVEFPHSLLLHGRQHVGVDVHRHTDLAVPQDFLHHLGMHPQAQQHCGRTVTQIVKANVR